MNKIRELVEFVRANFPDQWEASRAKHRRKFAAELEARRKAGAAFRAEMIERGHWPKNMPK